MPFIRNGRPEPGPDPSEGPQRPSSVSHKNPKNTFSFSCPLGHTTKPKSPAHLPKPLISWSNS